MGKGPLVRDVSDIRLAMLGMVDGNGHPYSWSAIFNGYDRRWMQECPFPVIPEYLFAQPEEAFGIRGAHVTHIWTDDPRDAEHVAKAARIPNIVARPEDVIGEVDAVIIPTDKGYEHVDRARPFVEAGLPLFIDKPLVDREDHLRQFVTWVNKGKPIMSSSAMRYAREYEALRARMDEVGEVRFATITTPKTWERYGIHALEGIYPFFGPGFLSARNTGTADRNVVHLKHTRGADVVVAAHKDMYGAFGVLKLHGTKGSLGTRPSDTFTSFKRQLESFIEFLETGEYPFPFEETVELMKLVIAGIRSREENCREVLLEEILAEG